MTMSDLVASYLETWNETDPAARRKAIDELWAPERLSAAGIGPDESRFDDALGAIAPALVA